MNTGLVLQIAKVFLRPALGVTVLGRKKNRPNVSGWASRSGTGDGFGKPFHGLSCARAYIGQQIWMTFMG